MTDILSQNLQIVSRRWPAIAKTLQSADASTINVDAEQQTLLINGLQLTSNINPEAEAKLQASLIAENSKTAYVYGPGLGDTIRHLLSRKQLKHINVVILNHVVFLYALNAVDHQDWLTDNRVQLLTASSQKEVQLPFCTNPVELQFAEDDAAILRDRIQLELNSAYANRQHMTTEIQKHINDNAQHFFTTDKPIDTLLPLKNAHVFIAAAGPTLEDHLDYLRSNSCFIIALDAAVSVLVKHQIMPDIIVTIDALSDKLFNDALINQCQSIPLVYFPSASTLLLSSWQGPRYYTYSQTQMFASLHHQFPCKTLFNAGSVIHPATDLAVTLGAKSVVLLGADFSFTKQKSHATDDLSSASKIDISQATHWLINGQGEKIPTLANFKGYLRDLERYIEQHTNVNFFTGSLLGAKIVGAPLWQVN